MAGYREISGHFFAYCRRLCVSEQLVAAIPPRMLVMNIFLWLLRVVVVLLLVWFASKNAELVSVNGLGTSLHAPLALVLLAFFGAGLLLGLLSSLLGMFRLKREIRQLNRALQNRAKDEEISLAAADTQVVSHDRTPS